MKERGEGRQNFELHPEETIEQPIRSEEVSRPEESPSPSEESVGSPEAIAAPESASTLNTVTAQPESNGAPLEHIPLPGEYTPEQLEEMLGWGDSEINV